MNYELFAEKMKALSDPNRVKILDLLSCDTLCACDLLEHFDFTQPTLSHHIKVLRDADLIVTEKIGTWHHYSVNRELSTEITEVLQNVFSSSERCICHTTINEKEDQYEKVSHL